MIQILESEVLDLNPGRLGLNLLALLGVIYIYIANDTKFLPCSLTERAPFYDQIVPLFFPLNLSDE